MKSLFPFFRLIRYKNLLFLALLQLIIRYCYVVPFTNGYVALSDGQYLLLVFVTVAIAAAGYIINNIYDQKTDAINKPQNQIVGIHISENKAYNLYIIFNFLGVIAAFYLCNVIQKPSFLGIFIGIIATLHRYSAYFKKQLLIGNTIVALLASLSILIIVFMDILPATFEGNIVLMKPCMSVLIDVSIITFLIHFAREIIKDIEDINGDYNDGARTLPIVIGKERSQKAVAILIVITNIILLIYSYLYLKNTSFLQLYLVVFVVLPLSYIGYLLCQKWQQKQIEKISTLLKIVLFLGMLSIPVFTLLVYYFQ